MNRIYRIVGGLVSATAATFAITRLINMTSSVPWATTMTHNLLWGEYFAFGSVLPILALRSDRLTIHLMFIATTSLIVYMVAVWLATSPGLVAMCALVMLGLTALTLSSLIDATYGPTNRPGSRISGSC